MLKICFVSLNSNALLSKSSQNYIGGAEFQQVTLANELQKRGYQIIFLTYSTGIKLNISKSNGITVIPVYVRDGDLNWFKKALLLFKKMKKIDADIYVHQAGSPGIVSIFSGLNRKKMIKMIASDADVSSRIIISNNIFIAILTKIADWMDILFANVVVCQNNFRKIFYKKNSRLKVF